MTKLKNNQLCLKFRLKLWKKDGGVKRYYSTKIRRIWSILKAEEFLKAYLKVSHGRQKDNHGKMVTFYNDGIYENKKDLRLAIKAFTEDYRKDTVKTIVNPARS